MRSGLRVFDADTHIHPSAETLEAYLDSDLRSKLPDREQFRVPIRIGLAGEVRQPPYRHSYRFSRGEGWGGGAPRILGEAAPREGAARRFQQFMGARFPTEGGVDDGAQIRLRDMDEEGVDVHMMVPAAPSGHPDPSIEMGFIRATHRYLDAFCGADSARLKSLIIVSARCIDESIAEIKRWGGSRWAVGIQPQFPLDYPFDHPDMNAVWAAAQDAGLAVVHHSFAFGYPGYRDLWENPFIGRTASHPWAAQRMVASLFGSGLMDRFPDLRFGILESGFGWLPWWAQRMDDQVIYMGTVAEGLKHKPSEYLMSGRFFASIVLHEGEGMVKMVTEQLGDGLLMFGSDYPHAESRFPESVDKVLAWDQLGAEAQHKLLWDNPVAFFGEP